MKNISELECRIEEALRKKAVLYVKHRDFESAAKIYEVLDEEKAKKFWEIEARKRKKDAEILKKKGRIKDAARAYEELANIYEKLDREEAQKAWREAGNLYMVLEKYTKAIGTIIAVRDMIISILTLNIKKEILKNLLDLYTNVYYLESAAEAYEKAGDMEIAKKIWEKVIKRLKFEAFLYDDIFKANYQKIAKIYKEKLKDEKAKKFYRAIAKREEKEKHYAAAANYYEIAKDLKKAIDMWKKYIEKSGDKSAYIKIARLYRKLNNNREADKALLIAADWYERKGYFETAAKVYEEAGKFEEAKLCLEKAIKNLEKELEEVKASLGFDPINDLDSINYAKVYEKKDDIEFFAKLCEKLADLYENKLIKNTRKAEDLRQIAGKTYMKLAETYKIYHLYDEVFSMYNSAAEAFRKAGDLENTKRALLLATLWSIERNHPIDMIIDTFRKAKQIGKK